MTTTTTPVRIKAAFGYYSETLNAPEDGYLCRDYPNYNQTTGKEVWPILEFDSVKEAVDYLTEPRNDSNQGDAMDCEYDGGGDFSFAGSFECAHGQNSRPVYTIVSRASGRCTKAIKSEIQNITA